MNILSLLLFRGKQILETIAIIILSRSILIITINNYISCTCKIVLIRDLHLNDIH